MSAPEPVKATGDLVEETVAPLEKLGRERSGEVGSLAHTNTWAGPTGGASDPAPVPELLPTSTTRLPELRLPAAIDTGLQLKAPIATTPPTPSTPSGAPAVPPRLSPGAAPSLSQGLPVLLSPDGQAPTVKAGSADGPAGPLAPDRSPLDHSPAGSEAGGSNFLPLLGLLALLALTVPRTYRRRMAVRHFPVPTAIVCALERPG